MLASFRAFFLFSLLALAVSCAVPLTGCTDNTSAVTGLVTRAVTFRIIWGTPTSVPDPSATDPSAIPAPDKAQSAILTLRNAQANGSNQTLNATRPDGGGLAEYRTTAKEGDTTVIAEFFLESNPNTDTGTRVGTVMLQKMVGQDTSANVITIDTTATIAQVVITPGQTVSVGSPLNLIYTAQNTAGTALPIPSGTPVMITVLSGTNSLMKNSDNQYQGAAPGSVMVMVTVGSIASKPETVTVTAANTGPGVGAITVK